MTAVEQQLELEQKVLAGLQKAFQKLLETKKQQGGDLVVMRDGKVVWLKPEEFE